MHTLVGHSYMVLSVAFSPNGDRIVSGSSDKLVKIWDTETGAEVSSFVEVHSGWRVGGGFIRAFPTFFVLRECGPGEWRGGVSRLLYQEGLT